MCPHTLPWSFLTCVFTATHCPSYPATLEGNSRLSNARSSPDAGVIFLRFSATLVQQCVDRILKVQLGKWAADGRDKCGFVTGGFWQLLTVQKSLVLFSIARILRRPKCRHQREHQKSTSRFNYFGEIELVLRPMRAQGFVEGRMQIQENLACHSTVWQGGGGGRALQGGIDSKTRAYRATTFSTLDATQPRPKVSKMLQNQEHQDHC